MYTFIKRLYTNIHTYICANIHTRCVRKESVLKLQNNDVKCILENYRFSPSKLPTTSLTYLPIFLRHASIKITPRIPHSSVFTGPSTSGKRVPLKNPLSLGKREKISWSQVGLVEMLVQQADIHRGKPFSGRGSRQEGRYNGESRENPSMRAGRRGGEG